VTSVGGQTGLGNPALPAGHSGEVYTIGQGVQTTVLTNTYVTPATANVGTVIFRPLEAKFTQNQEVTLHPYCKFKIGWHSGRSAVIKPNKKDKEDKHHDKEGKHHHEEGKHQHEHHGKEGEQHGKEGKSHHDTEPLTAWAETVALPRKHNEQFAKLKVKDLEPKNKKNRLGTAQIPLADVVAQGRTEQWYPILNKKNEVIGEIHIAMEYTSVLPK